MHEPRSLRRDPRWLTRDPGRALALTLGLVIGGMLSAAGGGASDDRASDVDATVSAGARPVAASAIALAATDRAGAAGIFEITETHSSAIADFNGDGWPDILLGRHHLPARLYVNNQNGTFTQVAFTFPAKDRHDCAWADVNRDAKLDLYCPLGARQGTVAKQNELWVQGATWSFVNRATTYGVTDPFGRGRASLFLDVNHDVYLDLYLGNDYPRKDGNPTPNRLFLNRTGSSFLSAPGHGVDKDLGGFCLQAADYDNDGWQDLLVCGKTALKLFRNNGGTAFTDVTSAVGISGKWTNAELVDLNGDARLDLLQIKLTAVQARLQQNGRFQAPVTLKSLQAGYKIATGDVNLDGRRDIYVVQRCASGTANLPDYVLLNQGSGTSFVQTAIPQTTAGCGEDVAPIDYNKDGRTDFLVLNGYHASQGPVQLLVFQ